MSVPSHTLAYKMAALGTNAGAGSEPFGYDAPTPSSCTHVGWTDERVELLKKLWSDGLSCSQIAKRLGGVTRNAVIGKVHRLGLLGRAGPSKPKTPTRSQLRQRPVNVNRMKAAQAEPRPPLDQTVVIPFRQEGPGLATSDTLGPHMCKWPIGDPKETGFSFCGHYVEEGSYCDPHHQLTHQVRTREQTAKDNKLAAYLRRYVA